MAGSRRTRVVVLSLIAVGLLVFAAVGVWMSPGGNKGQELGKGLGGVESGERGEIATTGGDHVAGTETGGPAASPLTHPLKSITGPARVSDLVGQHVELQVPIRQHVNDIAFWASFENHPLLVVLSRDMRDGRMRQAGDPARTWLEIADTIDSAVVSGRIERIPHAEAMYSWGLTNHDRDQLFDRPVYLKVDSVRPAQPAAGAY